MVCMAKCKCCHRKGFMVETDFNGLCSACAPYAQLQMADDIRLLQQLIRAIERIGYRESVLANIDQVAEVLERIKPYADAGLVELPMAADKLEKWLEEQQDYWQNES